MSIPIGWKTLGVIGWRQVAWRWHFFRPPHGSLCGRFAQPSTPDGLLHPRMLKRWRSSLNHSEQCYACPDCLSAVAGRESD